jgi:hypothetical protein
VRRPIKIASKPLKAEDDVVARSDSYKAGKAQKNDF